MKRCRITGERFIEILWQAEAGVSLSICDVKMAF